MRISDTSSELTSRADKRSRIHIECSPTLIAAIDHQVTAGYETAGVLFGSYSGSQIRILAFRPVDAAVAIPRDTEAGLREVLLAATADAELEPLVPVGWYRSRARSRPHLDRSDVAIYRRHFPEPWQVALVLCPDPPTPTRAAFFFHVGGASVRSDTLYEEFTIPRPGSAAFRALGKSRPLPPVLPRESDSSGPRWWLWVLSGLLLLLPFLGWFEPAPPQEQARNLSLRLSDDAGRLRIEWDREAPRILEATGGRLEIVDGPNTTSVTLDRADLRHGSVIYWRSHRETKVRMVLDGSGPEQVQESAYFVGPPAAIAPAPETEATPSGAALEEYLRQADRAAPQTPPLDTHPEPPPPRATKPLPRTFRPPAVRNAAVEPGTPTVAAPPQVPVVARADPRSAPPVQPSQHLPEPPRAAPPPRKPLAASSGQAIWTGTLERRGVVQIEGQRASQGYLSAPLPGTPAALTVLPGELTTSGLRLYTTDARLDGRSEAPGPQNGWNRTEYVYDPVQAGDISILEAPGEQNGWRHLVLRSESRTHSVVVLRWQPATRR